MKKNPMKTSYLELKKICDDKSEDSRLKYKKVTHPHFAYERTYCVVCSEPKGWVSTESSEHIRADNVILVCDDCCALYGSPPLVEAKISEVKVR